MRLRTLIWKELAERPTPMLTCLLAVLLGVTALVALRTVTVHSELAVARELDSRPADVYAATKERLHRPAVAAMEATAPDDDAVLAGWTSEQARQSIEAALAEVLGGRVGLVLSTHHDPAEAAAPAAPKQRPHPKQQQADAAADPFVQKAAELFDGDTSRIRYIAPNAEQ